MKTISIRVPDPLADWLDKEAAQLGRSQSEIIRDALEHVRGSAKGKRKSVGAQMAELGGFFKGGPRDGSTNKKYMKGFGE
ncbi:MAG: CopG family ribbon-helix-helix protein [Limisphaerales bacterium]